MTQFEQLLRLSNEKIDVICTQEKLREKIVHDEQVRCTHMITTIEEIRDEKVVVVHRYMSDHLINLLSFVMNCYT